MTVPNAPVPVYDGSPVVIPPDEYSRRIHDGAKAGRVAVQCDLLDQEIKQVEKMLPASPQRRPTSPGGRTNRASMPHRHTAAGARNSAADQLLIQQAHDALSRLGACGDGSGDGSGGR